MKVSGSAGFRILGFVILVLGQHIEPARADGLLDEAPERARQLLLDETKLLDSLDTLDRNLNEVAKSLKRTRDERDAWQLALKEAESRYRKVSREVADLRARLKARLQARRRLKLDSVAWRQMLFSKGTINDLIRQRGYLSSILGHDLKIVQDLNDAALNAQDAAAQRRASMLALDKAEGTLAHQRDELEKERSVQFEVLRQIRKRKNLMNVVMEKRDAWRRMLETNQNRLRFANASLPWPIIGKVRRSFGEVRDTNTGIVTRSGGWVMSGRGRAPVRSILSGRVAFSGRYGAFGHVMIVAHSEHFHSVYAHLDRRMLDEGDDVRTGQILGRLATLNTPGQPHFYFELRVDEKAVNPRKWLRKSP